MEGAASNDHHYTRNAGDEEEHGKQTNSNVESKDKLLWLRYCSPSGHGVEKIRIILQSAKKEQEREGDWGLGAFDEAGLTHRQRASLHLPLLDPPLSAQLILPAVADVAAASTGITCIKYS